MDYFERDLKLRMTFDEEAKISMLDFSSLLYDINLLNDLLVLTLLPDYKKFTFSQYFWYRKGRAIKDEHKLYLKSVRHESPIELVVIVAAAASSIPLVWGLIQSFEKIYNWKLNREKLRLEVENLKLKNDSMYLENQKKYYEIESEIAKKDALNIYERILRRLENYPFNVVDAKFYYDEEDKYDREKNEEKY